jgi:2-oxoisovalerate dehydrogenase E1 component alpha subunit
MEPHRLLALYHSMVMARAIDRNLWGREKSAQSAGWGRSSSPLAGEVPGEAGRRGRTLWISRVSGFESVQVAAAAALRPGTDWVVPHPNDLALCLAMGLSPLEVMLSPGDFSSRPARIVTTSGLSGTHIVHAAGIAYASKVRGLDEVTLASIGHRGTDSGDWHEGLNFAAVHRLPLVCLVQDNMARATAVPGQRAADVIGMRAGGYGMAGESIDGTDFQAALETLTRAVDRARAGEGPTLVHAMVVELTSLTPRGSRRTQEQLEAMSRQDPIEKMRRRLYASQLLDDTTEDQVHRDCISVVEAAIEQAGSAESAEPAAALDNVFQ